MSKVVVQRFIFLVSLVLFVLVEVDCWVPIERDELLQNEMALQLPPEELDMALRYKKPGIKKMSTDNLESENKLAENVLDILVEDKREYKEGEGEEGGGSELESDVDAEMIGKAERIADKDLLNGLNTILKNNETLQDVFRAENIYEFP